MFFTTPLDHEANLLFREGCSIEFNLNIWGRAVSKLTAADIAIDSIHSRAICDEIGERLRCVLNRDVSDTPPRLLMLMDRMARLECAPSIVPSIEDMLFVDDEDRTYPTKRRTERRRRLSTIESA